MTLPIFVMLGGLVPMSEINICHATVVSHLEHCISKVDLIRSNTKQFSLSLSSNIYLLITSSDGVDKSKKTTQIYFT